MEVLWFSSTNKIYIFYFIRNVLQTNSQGATKIFLLYINDVMERYYR